jgi:hypothetical protein
MPLTREELYELVWHKPMLRVGERFGVSSSYMARVCSDLHVPRPPRGYWAQLEFGKTVPDRPPLPIARPGDLTSWSPGSPLMPAQRQTSRQVEKAPALRKLRSAAELHALVEGVRPHFVKTRKSEVGLLRPYKRLLVDIVVSEKQLDVALAAANDIFMALEAKGHRVTFAPPDARMRRAEFDERESPNRNYYHRVAWSPDRITVVYVGDVPIGLTLFETTEEVEVLYVHGTYIPLSELSSTQLRRYQGPAYWKTHKSQCSGRFSLQAYCPNPMFAWTKQWRSGNGEALSELVLTIVRELEAAAPMLAQQVAEAEARAEAQRRQWQEEERRRREEQERARQVKMRDDAKNDLLNAIDAWARTRQVHEWLELVAKDAQELPEPDRSHLLGRLEQAKVIVGGRDALELLKAWKSPGER